MEKRRLKVYIAVQNMHEKISAVKRTKQLEITKAITSKKYIVHPFLVQENQKEHEKMDSRISAIRAEMQAIKECDVCVLLASNSISASMKFSYIAAQGKKTILFSSQTRCTFHLLLCNSHVFTLEDLLDKLADYQKTLIDEEETKC